MAEGLDFALKYPFTSGAKAALGAIELNGRIVELAVARIKKALGGDRSARLLLHDAEKKEELAAYAAARMILGALRNSYITNSFALNESKRVSDLLKKEDGATVELVASEFGIKTSGEGKRLALDLPTYLMYSTRNPHYRLMNRRLLSGMVEINYDEKIRLIEEAVRKRIEEIPLVKDPPPMIKAAGARLVEELPKTGAHAPIAVKEGDHPPCIARLMEEMNKHQNLPHQARLFLATYLISIGMGEDQITKMFSMLPDFNEKVTRYQVGHIARRGYSVPACSTVMTYGLCVAICRIGSPINWHGLEEARKEALRKRD